MSYYPVLKVNPTDIHGRSLLSSDSFGRLRVASPHTIFDSRQIADNQSLVWDDQQLSGGSTTSTYNTNQASTSIAVANNTAGVRARQTFRWFNYQSGKGQLVEMTFVMSSAPVAGIKRRVGQFNANNGVFFEQSGATLYFTRRTFTSGSAVDTQVAQSDWNLDRLDGTGPSRITLDTTKAQILHIDYGWLGENSIGFGFVIDRKLIYAHQMNIANTISLPWSSNSNLPLRYEITNTGTGPAASLMHVCSTVITEGGRDNPGITRSIGREATPLTTLNNTNLYPVLAMRLRSGYLHSQVLPKNISISCPTNVDMHWKLLLNPTITGTALSYATVANSGVEAATGATNATTISGGTALTEGYANNSISVDQRIDSDLQIGSTIAGVADVLVLAVRKLTGALAEDFYAAITYHEAQ